jgi:ApaG protein
MQKLERSLYRSFIRFAASLAHTGKGIYLQHRLNPSHEVSWLYFDIPSNNIAIVNNLFNWPALIQDSVVPFLESMPSRWIDGPTLKGLFQKAFRVPIAKEKRGEYVDFSLEVLREMQLLRKLSAQTSVTKDPSGLVITCTSVFSERDSQLQHSHYTHYYRILIENNGDAPVQLLNRSWIFKANNGTPPAVLPKWAPGVVGERPLLSTGEGFHYMSSTKIGASSGYMEGTFQFSNAKGELFEVPVGRCELSDAKFM